MWNNCLAQVAPLTPLRENVCPPPPPPPEGVVISEVASIHWTNHSQQRAFVELHGPPMTALRGLVLTVFEQGRSWTTLALPLSGFTDQDGFYVVSNVTGAGEVSDTWSMDELMVLLILKQILTSSCTLPFLCLINVIMC